VREIFPQLNFAWSKFSVPRGTAPRGDNF